MPDHGFGKISARDVDFSQDGPQDGGLRAGAAARAVFEYDFAIDGGAVGTITLRGTPIPANAVVMNAVLVKTAQLTTTNNDGSITMQIEAAGDLLGATTLAGATASVVQLTPVWGTVGNYVQTTVPRSVKMVLTVDAILTGRFYVVLDYVVVDKAKA